MMVKSYSAAAHTAGSTEHHNFEEDFAGEFGRVRRTGLEVDPEKLISGEKRLRGLNNMPLMHSTREGWDVTEKCDKVEETITSTSTSKQTGACDNQIKLPKSFKLPKLVRIVDMPQIYKDQPITLPCTQDLQKSFRIPLVRLDTQKETSPSINDSSTDLEMPASPRLPTLSESSAEVFVRNYIPLPCNLDSGTDSVSAAESVPTEDVSDNGDDSGEEYIDAEGKHSGPSEPEAKDSVGHGDPPQSHKRSTTQTTTQPLKKSKIQPSNVDDENKDEDTLCNVNEGGKRPIVVSNPGLEAQLSALKKEILMKLHGKSYTNPYEIDEKVDEIYNMIESTVKRGDKHSCLIFGARNSGKTCSFNAAVRRLRSELSQNSDVVKDFIVIRVNGLCHNTDQEAVRAIAEQLDSEISRIYNVNLRELDAKELLSRKSITNTFANILQVLDKDIVLADGESAKISHPLIFCIDEVDVYANQNRQTLLYNLFDLVENSRTPICVLCFTSKFTVKELLEKRVRSRFSQRSLHFRKLPLDKFLNVAKKLLQVDEPQNELEVEWNDKINSLVETNTKVRRMLIHNHLSTNNIKEFQNSCVFPVASLTSGVLKDQEFGRYLDNQFQATYVKMINSLSDLELYLLVSAARVITKTEMSWVNLNIVYEEYSSQLDARGREVGSRTGFGAVATTGFKRWSKESCKSCWEALIQMGILTMPGQWGRADSSNSPFETRMWQVELTLDELRLLVDPARPAKSWTRL